MGGISLKRRRRIDFYKAKYYNETVRNGRLDSRFRHLDLPI